MSGIKRIPVTTTESFPGRKIEKFLGMARGSSVRAATATRSRPG